MKRFVICVLPAAIAAAALVKGQGMDDIRVQAFSAEKRDLSAAGIGAYPLEGKVEALLRQPHPPAWTPTGFVRADYLDLMEPIVRMGAQWVDETGALIDPVIQREWAQATPRFVSSAAILLHFGRAQELRDTVFRAMTYCCARLSDPATRDSSPDFWMRELVTAYLCLKPIAPPEQVEQWRQALAKVNPEAVYQCVDATHTKLQSFHNWAVYSSAGESMRASAGIGASGDFLWGHGFFDTYMAAQTHRFTEFGMYRDPADPITYDITTRLQFASAIAFGYDGAQRGMLEEILRRGNLTMLLFVSPQGFVPYGGRSSQFNFQEAIVSALCELEARRYKRTDPALAGAFKRQARRSALAVKPWLLESNPPRHIKNQFPPETLHGCDTYGQYSVYSMLAASFFGLAALYADDTIPEQPTPAELGGYVVELAPAFHKVFAACGGHCVEIDTCADKEHDATGIGRLLFGGLPPALPLGMPFAAHPKYQLAPGVAFPALATAMGPEWDHGGGVRRLAEWESPIASALRVVEETPQCVAFEVTYRKKGHTVRETCRLTSEGLDVVCSVETAGVPVQPLRYLVPILVTDGAVRSVVTRAASSLRVALGGAAVDISWSPAISATLRPGEFANRHGVYQALVLEAADGVIRFTVRP
jgi:hypothetical protein